MRLRRGEAEGDELEGFECEEVGEMASKLDRATLEEREGWSERDMEVVDPCMSLIQVSECKILILGGAEHNIVPPGPSGNGYIRGM